MAAKPGLFGTADHPARASHSRDEGAMERVSNESRPNRGRSACFHSFTARCRAIAPRPYHMRYFGDLCELTIRLQLHTVANPRSPLRVKRLVTDSELIHRSLFRLPAGRGRQLKALGALG
jgi:hypothetical protein